MDKKQKKTMLVVGGLAVIGIGGYLYMKNRGSSSVPAGSQNGQDLLTSSQPTSSGSLTNFVPGGRIDTQPIVVRTDDTVQNPVGRNIDSPSRPQSIPAASTSTAVPAGSDNTPITETVKQVVMAWVDADGRPPIEAIGQARIPAEFNGMYDIIQGGWNPTDDQRLFWNNLIAKYDPYHNYL